MKKTAYYKTVILLTAILTISMVFSGCQSMDDSRHNAETGRTGVSGHALMVNINPSRVPANYNARTHAHIRFVSLKDMTPVPNARVRLLISGGIGIAHFGDYRLVTDAVTNEFGEVSVEIFVGGLPNDIAEVEFILDVQSTIEYDKWNTLIVEAKEPFYVYNPYYTGF